MTWLRMARYMSVVALFGVLGAIPQSAWATLPTPNEPILVVQNSGSADPYQNFVPELLTTEGLNGFQVAQLPELTAAFLANYDVVILPHLTLTSAQATLFQNYVNAGGTLVGFRPDLQLANVFGVSSLGTTLAEGWLKINTSTQYASALDSSVMKFHGTADLYSLNGASALAALYNSPTSATSSPAAAIYTFGSGKAILFSFDLTQSNVLMRQGNPAWAGYPNNHDGFNTMRASQMFMDQGTGQFWNDLGNGALSDVPQADIQLRLFSNALVLSNAVKRPLPRLWYFPSQNRAMLLMTGDHHGDAVANSTTEINTIQSFGGKFSEFLWYPFGSISNSQVNTWLSAGHAMGVHFDDTWEVDASGVGGSAASWNGMQNTISNALSAFAAAYPTAPPPTTTRNHFVIWLSRNAAGAPDQTAQAKLFQNAGIEFDTSYNAFPNRWGYITGSGLPMKFLDTATGVVIPVYEQLTQYEDDIQLPSGATYSLNWDLPTAQSHYQQSLSESLTKYNTVITMLFHPDHWSSYSGYAQTVLQYAQANSIPMYSTAAWLQFWKARAATALSMPSFTSNTLAFTATGSPAGLTLLVPHASGSNKVVSTFQVDGVAQSFAVAEYQGVTYASVMLTAGTHNISVTYATAGRILGQISPGVAAASTTVQVQGGSITQNVPVAADGTYVTGPLVAGTYTVTPAALDYTFTPSSRSVTLNSSDVTNVNFTATFNPQAQTLLTTQVPAVLNDSDGPSVNLELGMAFRSAANGQITAIRFRKASNETGTHVGRLWSSAGVLLGSVAFAGETASGWQQQSLTAPIAIAANTTYVVSVNTGNSYYVSTAGGFSTQVVNGSLSSVVGNNGLYGPTGQFPTNTATGSWANSNYFRDIVFVPGTTYTIAGTISPAASGSGATVTLSGAANATATADGSGNYTFAGLVNGSYTITPSKSGFTFSPASAPATVNNANVSGINFAAAVSTYSISGTVSPSGSGTTVTLSGAAGGSTTADGSGNYSFTGLANGSYTVTPSKSGFTFSPASAPATVNNANVSGINFAAAVSTYSISGTVSPSGSGTTVTLSGAAGGSATADGSGNYSFTGLANGSYTVTPSKSGFTFSPTNAPATVTNANVTGVNFTATAIPTYSISGTVSPSGSGTTVTLSGAANATATADGSGNYTFAGLVNGSYTITPSKSGFTFSPASAPATVNNANVSGINFAAAVSTYSISGTVSPSGSGTTVTLSGAASASTTADGSGNYSFTGLANGSYTVTPSKSGFTFSPTNAAATVTNANVTGVNFTATPIPTYSISGTVSPSGSGATVTLSGAAGGSATADGSGNYSFTGLANGSYTVTPSKSGFTFSPTNAAATVNNANVTGVNFTATAIPLGQTLLTTQVPVVVNDSDGPSVNLELGMAFISATNGQITAIRFWKASNETGTHVGKVWSSTGVLLGSVAFAGETASGWQQQSLTAPIAIAANTTYVVSVNTGNSYYVSTPGGFSTQVVNGSLSSVMGNNGLYGPTGQFPTNSPTGSWANSNYFRDIVFVPGATYSITGTISPAASGSGATVTLSGAANATATADGSGNYTFAGLVNGSYTVTPSKSGFTFSPTNAPATISNADVAGLSFTATAVPTYSISGTVGANGNGATVTLSGAASATATADGSGNYSFTGLVNGSYTVTPSKSGYTFNPANAPATVTNANVTGVNFTATAAPTPITDVGAGALGATQTTTDATATAPSGTAAGDIALVYCWVRSTADTTDVSGYAQIPGTQVNTSTGSHSWWWRRLTGPAGTATCNKSASADSYARQFVFRGVVASGNPWNAVSAGQAGTPNASGIYTATGIITGAANSMVVVFSGYQDNDEASVAMTSTSPASYTTVYAESSVGNDGSISMGYAIRSAAGATGNITIDYNTVAGSDPAGTLVLSLSPY